MVGGTCTYLGLSLEYSHSLDDVNDLCDDTVAIPSLISIRVPSPPDNPVFRKALLDPNSAVLPPDSSPPAEFPLALQPFALPTLLK
jgi:hypothetical protein